MNDSLINRDNRPWVRDESYAQWVASALKRARTSSGSIYTLFDSSVPEPREMLRSLMAEGIVPEFSPYFTSAFGDGNPFVIDLLADSYGVEPRRILCTTGATGGMSLIYRTLTRPGDHILIETPGFDLFADLAASHGVEAQTFPRTGDDFAIDLERLEALIRPETRLIVISNLHNPSGMVVPHSMMLSLAALAERRGIVVAVDEVYGDYADNAARPVAAVSVSPNFLSVASLTKIYGLGALRCGWVVGSEELIARLRDVSARVEFNVSTISHAIGAHILANREAFDIYSARTVAETRPVFDRWYAALRAEGLIDGALPEFGCICFPRLPTIADTEPFSQWLAARSGVIVAPGECFDAPGHIRIGFAQSLPNLERGLDALAEGIRAYTAQAGVRAEAG